MKFPTHLDSVQYLISSRIYAQLKLYTFFQFWILNYQDTKRLRIVRVVAYNKSFWITKQLTWKLLKCVATENVRSWFDSRTQNLILRFLNLVGDKSGRDGVLGRFKHPLYQRHCTKVSKSKEQVLFVLESKLKRAFLVATHFSSFKSKLFCDSKTFTVSHNSYNSQAFGLENSKFRNKKRTQI